MATEIDGNSRKFTEIHGNLSLEFVPRIVARIQHRNIKKIIRNRINCTTSAATTSTKRFMCNVFVSMMLTTACVIALFASYMATEIDGNSRKFTEIHGNLSLEFVPRVVARVRRGNIKKSFSTETIARQVQQQPQQSTERSTQ